MKTIKVLKEINKFLGFELEEIARNLTLEEAVKILKTSEEREVIDIYWSIKKTERENGKDKVLRQEEGNILSLEETLHKELMNENPDPIAVEIAVKLSPIDNHHANYDCYRLVIY